MGSKNNNYTNTKIKMKNKIKSIDFKKLYDYNTNIIKNDKEKFYEKVSSLN